MKIVITGGAGFIGTNLCEFLSSTEHEVTVIDNLHSGDKERLSQQITFHQLDIRETETLAEVFQSHDVIVHLAALPPVQFSIDEPVVAHDYNVNGTLSVLEAAKTAGVKRVVFAASAAAYGDQEIPTLSPDLPVQPKSPYALHKYYGECMMRLWSELYGVETVSLRFFNVYGPYLDPTGPYALVVGKFLQLAQAGEPLTITGSGEQTRDFIHVKDIARAIVLAIESDQVGKGEVLNIGSGVGTSVNRLAELFGGDTINIAPRIEPMHSVADISKTKQLLQWEPTVSLEEGIAALKAQFDL